jgi:tetratricopeptide (TPR) repeat protein
LAASRSRVSDPNEVLRDIVAAAAADAGKASGRARAAVRDYPGLPLAHRVLAMTLRRLGNVAEAERMELKAIEIGLRQPAVVDAEKALADDQLEEAERLIRPYLRANPEDAGAALILGSIAERCYAGKEAENLYRRAILLAPAYLEARMLLTKLLNGSGRYEEGLGELEHILEREPNHAAALSLKATVLVQYRRLEEAKPVFERLLRAHPADVLAWVGYAHLLKTSGAIVEAIQAYRKAVTIDPGRGIAWWGMANLKTFRFAADDITQMREGLARDDIGDDDRIHLHFALGKALGDAGDAVGAFPHYAQGNALRLAQAPHDADTVHRNVLRAERTFTPAFFARVAGAGFSARDPIFIVSLPRSGSTLIEQILASHAAIEGTEELFDIERIARELAPGEPPGSYMDKVVALPPAKLAELGKHYIEATRRHRHTDRPHFTDKMPSNWVFSGLIHAMLPNAKIVDIRRHPVGCGFANFTQHYNWGINFSYDQESIGRFYSDYVRQMAHFDRVAPGLVHRVHYEDLVQDLEGEVRRLLDYLELPFDEACLRFHENKRAVHTPSSEQVRRPINRDGMDTWRFYEPWLDPLKAALGPVLDCYPAVPDRWPDGA